MRRLDALDRDAAAGDRREADEATPTSMWSVPIRHSPPRSDSTPSDAEDVRLDPLDVRAERDEEAAEVLHVRLARGVADHRLPGRENGRHDRVLRRHDARLVEEDAACRAGRSARSCRSGTPMSISAPSSANAWMCGSRRRRPITSPPGGGTLTPPRRASSGPASRNDARIRLHSSSSRSRLRIVGGRDAHLVRPRPLGVGADVGEQGDHRVDVADARHVRQRHRLVGEQARGEDRQRAVLVPRGADGAATAGGRPR